MSRPGRQSSSMVKAISHLQLALIAGRGMSRTPRNGGTNCDQWQCRREGAEWSMPVARATRRRRVAPGSCNCASGAPRERFDTASCSAASAFGYFLFFVLYCVRGINGNRALQSEAGPCMENVSASMSLIPPMRCGRLSGRSDTTHCCWPAKHSIGYPLSSFEPAQRPVQDLSRRNMYKTKMKVENLST